MRVLDLDSVSEESSVWEPKDGDWFRETLLTLLNDAFSVPSPADTGSVMALAGICPTP